MSESAPEKKQIKTVAVFCGSQFGDSPIFADAARRVGILLAEDGIDLAYGGGTSGLMGVVSKPFRDLGRKVHAIITHAFRKSSGYSPLDGVQEAVVHRLPTRKRYLIERADACIVLAGGIGTLDEMCDALALIDMQMAGNSKSYVKPVIVLDTDGVYEHLDLLLKELVKRKFIRPERANLVRFVTTPEDVRQKIRTWNAEGIKRACDLVAEARQAEAANVTTPVHGARMS